jgi:hypothetical protein
VALLAVLASLPMAVRAATVPVESPDPSAAPSSSPEPGTSAANELQAQIDQLTAEVATLSAERDRLAGVVDQFDHLYQPMEADRLLLQELRKDLPETRAEADAYLARLQQLALQSDPSRLASIAERMMDAAPAFLDWRDQDFPTQEAAAQAFVDTGASAFGETFVEMRNAILLTVASRIDAVLSGIDRTR